MGPESDKYYVIYRWRAHNPAAVGWATTYGYLYSVTDAYICPPFLNRIKKPAMINFGKVGR